MIFTFNPEKRFSNKSNATRAARKAGLEVFEVHQDNEGWFFSVPADAPAPAPEPVEATEARDEELGVILGEVYEAPAQVDEDENNIAVALAEALLGEELEVKAKKSAPHAHGRLLKNPRRVGKTAKAPVEAAAPKAPKTVKEPKAPKPAKEPTERAPSGMVVKILELAMRKEGVTPKELNKLTQWKGAPWKWLFSNWQQTGYCDRWGYDFEAVKDGRASIYYVHKRD